MRTRTLLPLIALTAALTFVGYRAIRLHVDNRILSARISSLNNPLTLSVLDSEVLDTTLYETLFASHDSTGTDVVVLNVVDRPAFSEHVTLWREEAVVLKIQRKLEFWVAAARVDVLGSFDEWSKIGISRALLIKDLRRFVLRTGLGVAPQTVVVSGTKRVIAVVGGDPTKAAVRQALNRVLNGQLGVLWMQHPGYLPLLRLEKP